MSLYLSFYNARNYITKDQPDAMTITMTFYEEYEASQALHAPAAWTCLHDVVYRKIHNHLKHGTPLTMEELRDYILNYLHENGVTLDGMVE